VLDELVSNHRAAIVSDWFESIVGAYPDETARFLRQSKEPFGNPVGTALREELGTILDGALGRVSDDRLLSSLDRIIRVRAVQEFSAAAAVGFVFDLKPILNRLVESTDAATPDLGPRIDRSVDRVALMAFDVYTTCREQIAEIRIRSIRDLSSKQIERLNEWRGRQDRELAAEDAEGT
jgi:hypothetical protein